mmetsp:Transcript_15279/g.49951  ORF Transcript_15279/g.49951 Transcript_15279/m.49951 type:complete len:374 (-) Transcript_15279:1456-2577(-)
MRPHLDRRRAGADASTTCTRVSPGNVMDVDTIGGAASTAAKAKNVSRTVRSLDRREVRARRVHSQGSLGFASLRRREKPKHFQDAALPHDDADAGVRRREEGRRCWKLPPACVRRSSATADASKIVSSAATSNERPVPSRRASSVVTVVEARATRTAGTTREGCLSSSLCWSFFARKGLEAVAAARDASTRTSVGVRDAERSGPSIDGAAPVVAEAKRPRFDAEGVAPLRVDLDADVGRLEPERPLVVVRLFSEGSLLVEVDHVQFVVVVSHPGGPRTRTTRAGGRTTVSSRGRRSSRTRTLSSTAGRRAGPRATRVRRARGRSRRRGPGRSSKRRSPTTGSVSFLFGDVVQGDLDGPRVHSARNDRRPPAPS